MFDIGAMELFVVATLALVVVGPKELPKLIRTVSGFIRRMRELAADFRSGVEDLAAEVEKEIDPFADLRKKEGLRPGMSPSEITEHILANREEENSIASEAQKSAAQNTAMQHKKEPSTAISSEKSAENGVKKAKSGQETDKNLTTKKKTASNKKSKPSPKKASSSNASNTSKTDETPS